MSVKIITLSIRLNCGKQVLVNQATNTLLTPDLTAEDIKETAEKVKAFEAAHGLT